MNTLSLPLKGDVKFTVSRFYVIPVSAYFILLLQKFVRFFEEEHL